MRVPERILLAQLDQLRTGGYASRMRTFTISLVSTLSMFLAACGGAEEKPESPVAPTPSGAASTTSLGSTAPNAVAPQTQLDEKLPSEVASPAKIACALTTQEWTAGTIHLRLLNKGDSFATVNHAEAIKVSVPAGTPQADAALYELDLGTATVKALVSSDEVPLHAKAAVVLGGFVVPLGATRLQWTKSAVDSISFNVETGAMVKANADLKTTKPCAYFSLTEGRFDPIAVTGSPAPQKSALLRPVKNTLTGTMDGPAVAELNINDSAQKAGVLATSGSRSRIAWQTKDNLFFGWVPSSAMVSTAEGFAVPGSAREPQKAPPKRATTIPTYERRTCATDLPLVAEFKNESRLIGSVKANKVFELGPAHGALRLVSLPDSDLVVESGANLFVPRAASEKCALSK